MSVTKEQKRKGKKKATDVSMVLWLDSSTHKRLRVLAVEEGVTLQDIARRKLAEVTR